MKLKVLKLLAGGGELAYMGETLGLIPSGVGKKNSSLMDSLCHHFPLAQVYRPLSAFLS